MNFIRKKVFILFLLLFLISIPVFFFSLLLGAENLPFHALFSSREETLLLLNVRFMRIYYCLCFSFKLFSLEKENGRTIAHIEL